MTKTSPDILFQALIEQILAGATACHLDGSLVHEIGPYVESYTIEAKSAEQLLAEAYNPSRRRLLDYGCGVAHHRRFIESVGFDWCGADYLDSVSQTVLHNVSAMRDEIHLYDGRTLPFADRAFDVVYSMFVFHHLRHVDEAFGEIARVLDVGGRIIGQVSSMEQMQDYMTYNFTAFGLKVAAETAGLRLVKVYPKHDVFTFMFRRLMITLGAPDDNEFTPMLNPEGFVHQAFINVGRKLGLLPREVNLLRLKFCTQFVFEIEKP